MSYNEYEHSDLIHPVDIKALQARVVELEGQVSRLAESNTGRLQRERDALQARVAELETDRDEWKDAALSANERFKKAESLAAELQALRSQKLGMVLVPPVRELNWSELVTWWESGAEQWDGLRVIVSRMIGAPPVREPLSDVGIQAIWDVACQDLPQNPGWCRHIRFARAILEAERSKK
jgi:hypothetical protein